MTDRELLETLSARCLLLARQLEPLRHYADLPLLDPTLPQDRRRLAASMLHRLVDVTLLNQSAASLRPPHSQAVRRRIALLQFDIEEFAGPIAWTDRHRATLETEQLSKADWTAPIMHLLVGPYPDAFPQELHDAHEASQLWAAEELPKWAQRHGPGLLEVAADLRVAAADASPDDHVPTDLMLRCVRGTLTAHQTELVMAASDQPRQRLSDVAQRVTLWRSRARDPRLPDCARRAFGELKCKLAHAGDHELADALTFTQHKTQPAYVGFELSSCHSSEDPTLDDGTPTLRVTSNKPRDDDGPL